MRGVDASGRLLGGPRWASACFSPLLPCSHSGGAAHGAHTAYREIQRLRHRRGRFHTLVVVEHPPPADRQWLPRQGALGAQDYVGGPQSSLGPRSAGVGQRNNPASNILSRGLRQ